MRHSLPGGVQPARAPGSLERGHAHRSTGQGKHETSWTGWTDTRRDTDDRHHRGPARHVGGTRLRREQLRVTGVQAAVLHEHHLLRHTEENGLRRHGQRELEHEAPRLRPPEGQLRRPPDRDQGLRLRRTLRPPVAAQDGLRVYLDGTRKVDLWKNVSSTVKKTVNVTIPSGKHTLRVDYANWTGAANVSFGYTPRTTATVDKVKPLTPTGTSASYDTAGGNTRLSWAKNKEMDLAGYRVYRRLKGSTTWTKLTTTAAVSYTDTTVPATGDT
ncbi:hypothetical protein [Streptomyces sp. NBC_01483]|uniref:hypothetical protein n=1 Tax=Streptomyces sp. NBC_01483 TaxID=2903883 RepID=UPI003FCD6162